MSIPVLNDVYQEVRRLAIAGSVIAPGDFRLKKLIEPLRKSGEKAPVFGKVADGVEKLVASNEKTSAAALLELGALVTSILYTQGTTGIEGEWKEIPSSPFQSLQTKTSARVLKPLIEALTSTGSGRLELINDAVEQGLFNDLRLIRPALQAIDDKYSEIGDLIVQKVLPLFGPAIAPELKGAVDLKGKAGHARRLLLLHKLAPAEARDLVMRALDEGSKEVKLAAIRCLDDSDQDLSYLLDQARARSQEVRGAAISALVRSSHQLALKCLVPMLDNKDLPLLAQSIDDHVSDALAGEAASKLGATADELLAQKDRNKHQSLAEKVLHLLRILHPQREKWISLMTGLLARSDAMLSIKTQISGLDIIQKLVDELCGAGDTGWNYVLENRDRLPPECFGQIATAGRDRLPAQAFFDRFSPYIKPAAKKNTAESVRFQHLRDTLIEYKDPHVAEFFFRYRDPRKPLAPDWINLAIRNDLSNVVYQNAIPDHQDLKAYLNVRWEDAVKRKAWDELISIGYAMHTSKHPDFETSILSLLASSINKASMNPIVYRLIFLARRMSPAAIPALEAMVADSEKSASRQRELMECIDAIRERSVAAQAETTPG